MHSQNTPAYILVTAAYNEGKHIEGTIQSVISQTILPLKWVIVSDGSTDDTDAIVKVYADRYPFIQLHRITEDHPRNFAAQVNAINVGYREVSNLQFEFCANLDADIGMEPAYYETLLNRMQADPSFGLVGGFVYEDHGKGFRNRRTNSLYSVAHAVQFFRRECYEAIGGYIPLKYGGPDWVAEVMVRQKGWIVRSFPDLVVRHYRPAASAGGFVRGWYRQGQMDYSLGSVPLFEIVKCLRRIPEHPIFVGALARMVAFSVSYLMRAPRLVPPEFVRYLRQEQRRRLFAMIRLGADGAGWNLFSDRTQIKSAQSTQPARSLQTTPDVSPPSKPTI